jgi:pre-mRNA-processing factor SLU7
MRDNPLQNVPPGRGTSRRCLAIRLRLRTLTLEDGFSRDNFLQYSGEAPEVQELQLFCVAVGGSWERRSPECEYNARPTSSPSMQREEGRAPRFVEGRRSTSQVRGVEYLKTVPKELRLGQTEEYVE